MKHFKLIYKLTMTVLLLALMVSSVSASSHREAPLIANDPLADNVDLYAFKSPDNPDMITIIATYVPFQLPHGGPNYYNFGENVRYEIHVDNDPGVSGDEVTYRFTFTIINEDPTTFFNIRLGKQNQKTTYKLERSMDGGQSFTTIVENGIVPPNNIGPRSIESGVGLNTSYETLWQIAITTASTGERVFAGPSDDPFFVDLGGVFDLGDAPRQDGNAVDGVACYNVSTIAIQVPISTLKKSGSSAQPANILDSEYVIGVWASASRPAITTLSKETNPTYDGDWIQVSRLGMPLTNEVVIPVGDKDYWNSITPYDEISETTLDKYFYNPELALYMDDDLFGPAIPALAPLRIQTNSLGAFDFSNGGDGLFALKGSDAVKGTALDDDVFGTLLLPGPGMPRSVDLWPTFHTGVPNLEPYQLATGKEGNPLAAGKPFVNNFLPNGGDMLRLNMAVPATSRVDPNFSSLGLIQAAAIGLTVAPFNTRADLEFIPNMDGFPNGRRLEDDVTRIELQAVSGVVLAAIGLWYDDYDPATSGSPVTTDLLNVLTYTTGVEANDRPFSTTFPYVALPFSGTGDCSGMVIKEEEVCEVAGGILTTEGGAKDVTICSDGTPDPFNVLLTGNEGLLMAWIITDNAGKILGLPASPPFDLDGAGEGECSIYHLSYSGDIGKIEVGENISGFTGCFALSNAIVVSRLPASICAPVLEGCHVPQNLKLKKVGKRRVSIRWDRVKSARSYEVLIGFEGVPQSFFVVPVRGRRIFITGPPNRTIVVQVRAVCSRGEKSDYTDPISFDDNSSKAAGSRSGNSSEILVSELEFDLTLSLSPNPTTDRVNVTFNTGNEVHDLSVFDMTGKRVKLMTLQNNKQNHVIEMSDLNDGMYLISISKEGMSVANEKVIIARK